MSRTRIVVTGASGNVGTGVLTALAKQLPDAEVVGVCRRPPTSGPAYEPVRWHAVDLSSPTAATELEPAMRDADVVVHLALAVQPPSDEGYLYRANVLGTQAVLHAVVSAGADHLVYASSLGIYAPGAEAPVSEDWPDTGQATSTYSRHKVAVERMLDRFVEQHPETIVARFRPTVVVQRNAACLIKSLYVGPLVPRAFFGLLHRRRLPVLPLPAGLALQFVHADDVGDLVARLIRRRARGSFNVAADVLDSEALGDLVGARVVEVNPKAVRAVVVILRALRLVPLTPGWYDVATNSPLMDTAKARQELDWAPTRSSTESALELIGGLADGAIGTSAATGWKTTPPGSVRGVADRAHDTSLSLWTALALARAIGVGRAGVPDAVVVATNLVSGTPMALARIRARRHDAIALLAPATVAAALLASVRGGWLLVAATAALQLLNAAERRRSTARTSAPQRDLDRRT